MRYTIICPCGADLSRFAPKDAPITTAWQFLCFTPPDGCGSRLYVTGVDEEDDGMGRVLLSKLPPEPGDPR